MSIAFYKYQGTGNDFIMVDDRNGQFPASDTGLIAALCNRRFGIGADGLILLQNHPDVDFYMQYFNSDGRESSMCGNGGRCIVAFARQLGIIEDKTLFFAVDGIHHAHISGDVVELQMKDVESVDIRDSNTYILNTGSPHFVKFMNGDLSHLEIVTEAHRIRYNEEFAAEGINVNFVNTEHDPASLKIRTYERGVEDETLSCGTGVTASAIAYGLKMHLNGGAHTIDVEVMGGQLKVSYILDDQKKTFKEVWLIGPARFVFEGILPLTF